MSFYITLPSNASMNIYKTNTLTNYRTQLIMPLKFDVPYEVALVEMIFRQSWTVELGLIKFRKNQKTFPYQVNPDDGALLSGLFEDFNKNLSEHVLDEKKKELKEVGISDFQITELLSDYEKSDIFPRLLFKNGEISFSNGPHEFFEFEGPIKNLFNAVYPWYNKDVEPISVKITNFHLIEALYVYTDIIDLQFTGDTRSQLLRSVVVSNNYSSLVSVNYETPHYVPINQNNISSINIDIRSDSGDHIHFIEGKVIIKLHFRPLRYGL